MVERSRILLVLDIDETLIYASDEPLSRAADFHAFQYHCYRRPGLAEFLQSVSQWFDLAIWSSASDPYVHAVAAAIVPPDVPIEFVWGRSRATLPRMYDPYLGWDVSHLEYVKTLAKIKRKGWPLERMLIVDDTPKKARRNYGNAIYPSEYLGDEGDVELFLLARYLETIKDCPNVRKVEKRGWRQIALDLEQ